MAEKKISAMLKDYKVEVKFSAMAVKDLKGYDKNINEQVIAVIVKRARNGPLIKPKGVGKPLGKELNGFSNIKLKSLNLRIVYRPVEKDDKIFMEIIAIGPRDKDTVYRKAVKRLYEFKKEMADL
jgi:mRNA interferase RelE/StbE